MKPDTVLEDPYKAFYNHHRKEFFQTIVYVIDTQTNMIQKLQMLWKHRTRKEAMNLMMKEIDLWRGTMVGMLQPYTNMKSRYFNPHELSIFSKYTKKSDDLEELVDQFRIFFGMNPIKIEK